MGADFLLYICHVPGKTGEAFASACKGLVKNMRDEDVHDFFKEVTCDHEDLCSWSDKEPTEQELLQKLRSTLVERLVEAERTLSNPNRRDLDIVQLQGTHYYMSGGMSWGDLPTEACDPINYLSYTGADMIGHTEPTKCCEKYGTPFSQEG